MPSLDNYKLRLLTYIHMGHEIWWLARGFWIIWRFAVYEGGIGLCSVEDQAQGSHTPGRPVVADELSARPLSLLKQKFPPEIGAGRVLWEPEL